MSVTHHLKGISSHGETISGLNFSIMYFNCRSMLPKFDELVATCSASHPDIVCLVETWLSVDILDSEIRGGSRGGGGMGGPCPPPPPLRD